MTVLAGEYIPGSEDEQKLEAAVNYLHDSCWPDMTEPIALCRYDGEVMGLEVSDGEQAKRFCLMALWSLENETYDELQTISATEITVVDDQEIVREFSTPPCNVAQTLSVKEVYEWVEKAKKLAKR